MNISPIVRVPGWLLALVPIAGLGFAAGRAADQAVQSPAEAGVTSTRILIGLEGPANAFSSDEENLGMRLVIEMVNARGGVHGRRLEARGYARKDVASTDELLANVRREVEEDRVFLIFNHGGPGSMRVAPYAMRTRVPYMFPHTALLTADADRYVFTSFPRYRGETAVMLRHLAADLGVRRIGVIYADNEYGRFFRDRVRELAPTLSYEAAGAETLNDRKPADATPQVRALQASKAQAVVLALYPEQARRVMEAKVALGWSDVRMVATGPLTDEAYLTLDDGGADGTLGFCLYPDPNVDRSSGVADYRRAMAQHFPGHAFNRYSLYGYVFGRLVVEGLERAGHELTRERFVDAMESIRNWDSGGILPPVSLSPDSHHAQRAGFICELRGGRFQPTTGWMEPQ